MGLRDGSTLINRGPPPKPPVASDWLPQQSAEGAQEQDLSKIVALLKNAIVEVIKVNTCLMRRHFVAIDYISGGRVARRFERGSKGLDRRSRILARYTQPHGQDSRRHPTSRRTICPVSLTFRKSVSVFELLGFRVLEDVHAQLKDALSKTGIKNAKIYQKIRSIALKRPSKCNLLFRTCKDNVARVANSLRVRGSGSLLGLAV